MPKISAKIDNMKFMLLTTTIYDRLKEEVEDQESGSEDD